MDEMTKEELLSAFLDGEVTAEQRAYVEKLIATDDEARVALEELRAMSAALKALPQMKVGEDLSERVLRRAERAILEQKPAQERVPAAVGNAAESAENKSSVETVVNKADKTLVQANGSAGASSGTSWGRRLAGPLAAIAAAVLIMVMSNQKEQAELAKGPMAPNFAPEPMDSMESEESSLRDESFQTAPDAGVEDRFAHRELGERGAPSMSAMRAPAKEATKEFAADRAAGGGPAADAELDGAVDKLARTEFPRSKVGDTLRGTEAPLPSGEQSQEGNIAGQPLASKRNRSDANAKQAQRGAFGLAGKKGGQSFTIERNELASQPQLVVDLVVSSAALESNAFDQLLARQNIYFDVPASTNDYDRLADGSSALRKTGQPGAAENPLRGNPAPPAAATAKAKPADSADDVSSKTAKADDAERRGLNEDAFVAGVGQSDERREKKPADESDESVELVYVVASAAQVQAALKEMQEQSQNYLAYSIEPQQMQSGDGSESAHAEEGAFQTETEIAENTFGRQQRSAVKTSEAAKSLLEKEQPKNQPQQGKKRDLNARPEESKDAEPAARAKPGIPKQPAQPSTEVPRVVTNASGDEKTGADKRESQSQSDSKLGWAREQTQATAGRAQRVQISVQELSRWRENSYEELPSRVALDQAKQSGQRRHQQARALDGTLADTELNDTQLPNPAPGKPKLQAKAEAEKPALENAAELAQETESKQKNAPVSEPAPAGNVAPSVAPPAELKVAGSRSPKPMAQEPAAPPAQFELQQQTAADPAGVQQQDLVRVLFVVRGAHFDRSKTTAGQTGAGAAEADVEATPQPKNESDSPKDSPPKDASPAPNASPQAE